MTTTIVDPVRQADARVLFGSFSALFATALILDQLWWGGFEVTSARAVVVLAAVWTLVRPSSVTRFAALAAAEVIAVALDLPFVGWPRGSRPQRGSRKWRSDVQPRCASTQHNSAANP